MSNFRLDLIFNGLLTRIFRIQRTLNSLLNFLFTLNFLAADTLDLINKDTLDFNFLHVIVHNKLFCQSLEEFWLKLTLFLLSDGILREGIRLELERIRVDNNISFWS